MSVTYFYPLDSCVLERVVEAFSDRVKVGSIENLTDLSGLCLCDLEERFTITISIFSPVSLPTAVIVHDNNKLTAGRESECVSPPNSREFGFKDLHENAISAPYISVFGTRIQPSCPITIADQDLCKNLVGSFERDWVLVAVIR